MDRKTIAQQYKVDAHGIIRSPGKFEGEQAYVVAFYDAFLNGGASESGDDWDAFELDANDVKEWPELAGYRYLVLFHSSDGFVVGQLRDNVDQLDTDTDD